MSTKSTNCDKIESPGGKNQPTSKPSSPSYSPTWAFTAKPKAKAKAHSLSRADYQRLIAAVATREIAAPKSSGQAVASATAMAAAGTGAGAAAAAALALAGMSAAAKQQELQQTVEELRERERGAEARASEMQGTIRKLENDVGLARARLRQAELPAELKYKDCAAALQSCEKLNKRLIREVAAATHEAWMNDYYQTYLEGRLKVYEQSEQQPENEQPPPKRARHESFR